MSASDVTNDDFVRQYEKTALDNASAMLTKLFVAEHVRRGLRLCVYFTLSVLSTSIEHARQS